MHVEIPDCTLFILMIHFIYYVGSKNSDHVHVFIGAHNTLLKNAFDLQNSLKYHMTYML